MATEACYHRSTCGLSALSLLHPSSKKRDMHPLACTRPVLPTRRAFFASQACTPRLLLAASKA
eukprot:326017-Lingulodinium_polyedra.AAC.1